MICGYRVARGDSDLDGVEITSANALDFTDVNIFDSRTNMALSVDATIPSEYVTIYPQIIVHGGAKSFQLLLDRESLQEGLGATQLRVTATLRVGSLPQDDIQIPIVFTNSTTTSADYTVSGTQAITISANQTSGSTMLTFTPVEDYIKEQRIETIRVEGGISVEGGMSEFLRIGHRTGGHRRAEHRVVGVTLNHHREWRRAGGGGHCGTWGRDRPGASASDSGNAESFRQCWRRRLYSGRATTARDHSRQCARHQRP